jgi:predicted nucleic acid-binding protein
MSGREFLDTNVLIYAHDDREPDKQAAARALIRRLVRERRGVVSVQVLQDFFAIATRKLGIPSEHARRQLLEYACFDVIALGFPDVVAAVDLHRIHHWSIWDALIVRAALSGSCAVLNTEDMQSGYAVDGLTLRNPFGERRTI